MSNNGLTLQICKDNLCVLADYFQYHHRFSANATHQLYTKFYYGLLETTRACFFKPSSNCLNSLVSQFLPLLDFPMQLYFILQCEPQSSIECSLPSFQHPALDAFSMTWIVPQPFTNRFSFIMLFDQRPYTNLSFALVLIGKQSQHDHL